MEYFSCQNELTLYEDEGVNYNYEKGAFGTIQFKYSEESGKLSIGEATGSFEGMLKSRTFNIVWVDKQKPVAYDLTQKPDATINYEGRAVERTRR